MIIRPATVEDAPAIAELVIAAWRVAFRGVLPDDILDTYDVDVRAGRLRHRIVEGWPTYVAELDGHIAGIARLSHLAPPAGFDCELEGLYVHPGAQRRGVGRALVRHVCELLAAKGHHSLYIQTLRDNVVGRAFYDKLGGRVTVETTWSYAGVSYPAVGYRWDDVAELARP